MNNNEQPTKRRGMTAEDLLRLRSVRDPHYAPDGTRVVFVEKSIDEENQYRSHLYNVDGRRRRPSMDVRALSRHEAALFPGRRNDRLFV
nr:hypothetical protein [Geobacillus sp. CAMR5420]